MNLTDNEKAIRKLMNKTKKSMKELDIYKPQFDTSIRRYAETLHIYNLQLDEFYQNGCKITEEYTNKAGATNERKTPLFLSLEKLRSDILALENVLGLNPQSFARLNKDKKDHTKEMSALEKVLMKVDLD